ncbi:peptidoglycan-binding protein [Streptomyces sp. GbtcB6]|uniref:peptidoglycan-binding protein n=1 Tax=Streptomyces sp. GbtcB6 TaxID=2824751 RepID=UPI001C2FF887|nr:peptidoglycan-binding protein [Streptomyces sp. GbtcB6]
MIAFSSRKVLAAAMATAALTAGAVSVAPAATASVSQGYVVGGGWGGSVQDDFGDEGPLDSSSHRTSLATALWQQILWADGLLPASGVDCDYGPNTTAATKGWQAKFGIYSDTGSLEKDGSAGPKTMGTADQWLTDQGNSRDIVYDGTEHDVTFRRVGGIYQISLNGAWRNASYTSSSGC